MESIAPREKNLPPAVGEPHASIADDILEICQLPTAEMEAAITIIFDQLASLQKHDPLQALLETIRVNQALNMELLKAHSPVLIAAAMDRADTHTSTGKLKPVSPAEEKMLGMTTKLQEASVRLSLANAKVSDEIQRRHRLHSKGTGNEQEERE